MEDWGDEREQCSAHPRQVIVGVCPHCLKERLLVLASQQRHSTLPKGAFRPQRILQRKAHTLHKVFALASFLHRPEFLQQKNDDSDEDACTSHDDSYISIKFEGNGLATWDHKVDSWEGVKASSLSHQKESVGPKSVVEHGKTRGNLRWRKRIAHLFQLTRWKRSSKTAACHISKGEVGKGRRSWLRSLTRKRSME
ncbi:hypothetical protein AMTRI_Chr11g98760 [Amborella trichopoda]|uniref:Uncharacterized protein n=1 Tax=Amborella trichopoda TaxID=13333 RepID=W1PN64_AMBTC|nr:uncharacterized protein LOC18436749 [Amborella trichopoda]ERN08615.1 hypothetical protein AMTR_s00017p00180400 [Amborella trichopoda]|eukprot:XP_006847034.1 uncharacterized protein LOC18436749 [Amborella trichopoda]